MYEAFYGFRSKPFSLLPDPEFLYPSKKHQMALTLLEYGLWNQASFSVITGDIGTGKTTMIRHLLNKLDRNLTVGLITNTHASFGELLQWILLAFNLDFNGKDRVGMYKTFVDFLIREYAANRRTILIIDEAQNMGHEALEELRMLSNINAEKDQVLQVILVGQIGLRDHLRDPSLEQFAQRIAVDYHLEPLDLEETREYIRHRLSVAGGDPNLFSDEACIAIHQYSGGVPRLINLLCDTAVVYGYAEQKRHIDLDLVNDVARDKYNGSILPLRKIPGEGSVDKGFKAEGVATEDNNTRGNLQVGKKHLKKKLQVLIVSDSEAQRSHLKMILERSGWHVVAAVILDEQSVNQTGHENVDVILIDLDKDSEYPPQYFDELIDRFQQWYKAPVLFNDSSSANNGTGSDLGRKLSLKLTSLMSRG